jgi:hypothetical protein
MLHYRKFWLPLSHEKITLFIQIYDENFSRQYGFWRPYVEQVIYRYLDCGNLPERVCPCEMQRLRQPHIA